MTDRHQLSVYLNNHLTGAAGGVELFRRVAGSHHGERGAELARLRDEVEQDRARLRDLMRRLGIEENTTMAFVGWVGERLGRLKPNGYVVRRAPLADVVEIEALRVGVRGKLAGWQVLRAVAVHDDRLDVAEIEELIDAAEDQERRLYKLHLQVAQERLTGGG